MQTSWRQINHLILLLVMASMLAGCATPILAAGSGIERAECANSHPIYRRNARRCHPYADAIPAACSH